MENQERDFKGVWIPKIIWLDKRLNALEKCILFEIDSLDGEHGCYASNKYLAEFCQCGETKVSTAISKLIDFGYIYVQSFDGRQRILRSNLSKNESLPFEKCKSEYQKIKQSNNNKDDIDNNKYIVEIVDFMNDICGTKFRAQSQVTRRHIIARLNEGYTVDDFKTVIRKKAKEWGLTDMAQYLRPETLFGSKFESYLNQPEVSRKASPQSAQVDFEEHTYTQEQLSNVARDIDSLSDDDI